MDNKTDNKKLRSILGSIINNNVISDYEHSFYGPQTDVKYECKESNQ